MARPPEFCSIKAETRHWREVISLLDSNSPSGSWRMGWNGAFKLIVREMKLDLEFRKLFFDDAFITSHGINRRVLGRDEIIYRPLRAIGTEVPSIAGRGFSIFDADFLAERVPDVRSCVWIKLDCPLEDEFRVGKLAENFYDRVITWWGMRYHRIFYDGIFTA